MAVCLWKDRRSDNITFYCYDTCWGEGYLGIYYLGRGEPLHPAFEMRAKASMIVWEETIKKRVFCCQFYHLVGYCEAFLLLWGVLCLQDDTVAYVSNGGATQVDQKYFFPGDQCAALLPSSSTTYCILYELHMDVLRVLCKNRQVNILVPYLAPYTLLFTGCLTKDLIQNYANQDYMRVNYTLIVLHS
jgi:hypothetical protein